MPEQFHRETGAVYIPGILLPIRLSQIGISKRLQTALRSLGKHFLGDLQGLSANDLLRVDHRGNEIMAELFDAVQTVAALAQSLNSSSTDPPGPPAEPDAAPCRARSYRKGPPDSTVSPPAVIRISSLENQSATVSLTVNIPELLSALENRLARLTPRDLKIVELRFGANAQPPASLHDISLALKLTGEGVRYILDQRLRSLRDFSGPELSGPLAILSTFCREHNLTLTPELLTPCLALKTAPAVNLRYDPAFHIRLLSELNPNLPAWPSAKTLHFAILLFCIQSWVRDLLGDWLPFLAGPVLTT